MSRTTRLYRTHFIHDDKRAKTGRKAKHREDYIMESLSQQIDRAVERDRARAVDEHYAPARHAVDEFRDRLYGLEDPTAELVSDLEDAGLHAVADELQAIYTAMESAIAALDIITEGE